MVELSDTSITSLNADSPDTDVTQHEAGVFFSQNKKYLCTRNMGMYSGLTGVTFVFCTEF